jgi:Antimicrobial peptide resistance and lipid A acylation protein PagP
MQHTTWTVCLAALLGSFCNNATAQSSDGAWDVVFNGRAVHMNAAKDWNEDNWGVGVEREFASPTSRWVKMALVNGFQDSMGDPSYMAGGGLKRRFRPGADDFYVDVGGIAFLMTRERVNDNRPFPGLLPAATFGFKRVAVNVTYLPESIADRATNSRTHDPSMHGVFFLQLKLDASLFGLGRHNRQYFAEDSSD